MTHPRRSLPGLLLFVVLCGGLGQGSSAQSTSPTPKPSAPAVQSPEPAPFDEAWIRLQYNASTDEAEILVFASTEVALSRWSIHGPRGLVHRAISPARSGRGVAEIGFESTVCSLPELLDAYPPGTYVVRGLSVDGLRWRSRIELDSHLPPAPVIVSPSATAGPVDRSELTIVWLPMLAEQLELVLEKHEEEQGDDGHDADTEVIRVKIPKGQGSLYVPASFLGPDCAYTVDLIATDRHGNRSYVEVDFRTAGG